MFELTGHPRYYAGMTRPVLVTMARIRAAALYNFLRNWRKESVLKIFVVGLLGIAFWISLFSMFNEGFRFLIDQIYPFRHLLIPPLLSFFFMTLILMLVFSNALISFGNLFRSPETTFLFSLPVRHDTIFLYKLMESMVFSSWAFFALGLPMLLAYGIRSGAQWPYYPGILLFLVPYVIIPAAIGALMGLLLTAFVPRHRGKVLAALAMFALAAGAFVSVELLRAHAGNAVGSISRGTPSEVHRVLGRLDFTQQVMTPNFWITQGLMTLGESGTRNLGNVTAFWSALMTSAAFLIVLGWFVAGSLYHSAFSGSTSSPGARRITSGKWLERLARPFMKRWPGVTVLVVKDVKTFLRDPVQWAQVLIFFGLLTVYIANLRNFSYPLEDPFYLNLISALNLKATCLTLATMVSRFVFPLISLEGQRFWVLGLVPLQRKSVLWSKFFFSLAGSLIMTETLVLLSNLILKTPLLIYIVQAITAALVSVGLTGLAVGMGALFPSLRETNPSKIVSGFGGTLTLILSISLVVLVVGAEAVIGYRYLVLDRGLDPNSPAAIEFYWTLGELMFGIVLLSLLTAYIPLRLGVRALERMEF